MLDFTNSNEPIEARHMAIASMLSEYECEVEFTKVSGEKRTMTCTLRQDMLPTAGQILSEDIANPPPKQGIITVWCTEDPGGWRAIRTANIHTVKIAPKRWTVTVEEDPETGEIILPLPENLLKLQGWTEGETLEWIDNGDGSWSLQKAKDD